MRRRVAGALLGGLGVGAVALGLAAGSGPATAQGLGRRSTGPTLVPPPVLTPRESSSPTPAPRTPVVREVPLVLGALLPVAGAASWYGDEIRRGLELALARVNPPPLAPAPAAGLGRPGSGPASSGIRPAAEGAGSEPAGDGLGPDVPSEDTPETTPESDPALAIPAPTRPPGAPEAGARGAREGDARGAGGPASPGTTPGRGGRGTAPLPPRLRVTLKVENADPQDPKALAQAWEQLLTAGATVVVTASPTPTLAIYPLASGRDVLVVHQGFRTERFPTTSRVLLHTRPSPADLGRAAAAYARDRGVRRLAVLTAGGDAGRATRAALGEAWRAAGRALVFDESLPLDSPDFPARLRRLAAATPEGVILVYRGEELGDLAARIRAAGIPAPLLVLDDDPAVALAGGPDLADVLVLSDAYVDPGEGEVFPEAYRGKHGREPSRFAAHAYETVMLVARAAEALMREGKAFGGGRLRETLRTVAPPSHAFGIPLGFRDDGTLGRPLALSTVERSRVHFVRYLEGPPGVQAPGPPPAR